MIRGILSVVLVLAAASLAACKGRDSTFTDAATGDDDPIDATAEPDAADESGPITVTTFNHYCFDPPNGRLGSVDIVVIGPDGSDTYRTDANGDLTVDVLPGSSVTAVYPLSPCNEHNITTFAGVAPGDALVFGTDQNFGSPTQSGTMTITWPAQGGIDSFQIYDDCYGAGAAGTATSAVITQYTNCSTPTTEVLVVGYTSGTPAIYAVLDDLPFVADGSAAITAFQTASLTNLDMTGIPASVGNAELSVSPLTGSSYGGTIYAYGAPDAGAITGSGVWTPGPDDAYLRAWFQGATYGQQYIHERVAPTAPFALADPALLPWVDAFIADITTGTLSWTESGTGTPDGTMLTLYWYRGTPPALWGVGGQSYYWTLILPHGAPSVTLPPLPGALSDRAPTTDDSVSGDVTLIESSAAGAGGLRELPEWESYCADCRDLGAATYPRVTISQAQSGGKLAAPPRRSADRHHLDRRQLQPLDR
jgi:hypothetical protein